MDKSAGSREARNVGLIGILVFIWLAGLVFYWSVDPGTNRHTLASIIISYLVLWGIAFLWSNASKREMAQRFLLTSVSVALTVGFLEILVLAKVVDFRVVLSTPVWEPWAHPGNLGDSRLLHIHRPYDVWPWNGIEYRYDQYGLRNDTDLEAADVIVIGDSFIEGLGVSASNLITSQLAKQLDRTVANVGQSWYGPQQELELLRRYGLRHRPKVCVWTFFEGNDLGDVQRYNDATRDWENFSKNLHSFRERSFSKNALLAVRRAVRRLINSLHHRGPANNSGFKDISGVFKKSSGDKTRLFFWYKGHRLSAKDYEALEELRSILVQAYELCRINGAKFVVVYAPMKFRVYNRFTEFDSHSPPQHWVINDLPRKVEAIVREELPDGQFLDLTTALAEEAKHGALLYFPYDSHWSPEGHRVAASAVAHFLMRWGENGVFSRNTKRVSRAGPAGDDAAVRVQRPRGAAAH